MHACFPQKLPILWLAQARLTDGICFGIGWLVGFLLEGRDGGDDDVEEGSGGVSVFFSP